MSNHTDRSGEIAINDWILRDPSKRAVHCIRWQAGEWRIGLTVADAAGFTSRGGHLPCAVHANYNTAAKNAVEIARLAGFE